MSDGIIIGSGFRFRSKIWSLWDFCHNVVVRERRQEESSRRIDSSYSRSGDSHNQFQRDQFNPSFGITSEKIGRWSMFKWFKRVTNFDDMDQVHEKFADHAKSNIEIQKVLAPYLDAKDPLIALTLTLLANKQKDEDRGS